MQYGATEGLLQAQPVNIRLFSDTADVEIRNFRIYNRALTDDEELNNYMVDRTTSDEMVLLFEKNDVTGDSGTDIGQATRPGKSGYADRRRCEPCQRHQ
ncbi:hypothetical protein NXW13_00675 [Bacteroides thetaiotaomicron]|nr:hypothetical protein [Bacteroides thetaiotaomicron]